MAEDTQDPPLGIVTDQDGDLVHKHHVRDVKSHYPYTCPLSHCAKDVLRCLKACCGLRLKARMTILSSEVSELYAERDKLVAKNAEIRKDIKDLWSVDFTNSEDHGGLYLDSDEMCIKGSECTSCVVERAIRTTAALKVENVLYRQQIETLRKYKVDRIEEEKTQIACANEDRGAVDDAKFQLTAIMDEIEQLEGQMNMVSWKGWRKDCEHRYAMEAIKSSPPSVICQCGCATCIEAKVGEFKEAEEKVNKYKDELYGKLGIGKGHKTTLQIERERLKEQAARDSPYGRTGSYRGHGAGALKPVRHLNSNSAAGKQNDAPAKTAKKGKKPGLVW